MKSLAVAMLLVAFAGFSGGCNKGSQDDPAQDKAFADQLANAPSKPKGKMPGVGKPAGLGQRNDSEKGPKDAASGTKPDANSAATKSDATGKQTTDPGN